MNGLFASIVEITNGKCRLSFDVAAPSQITMKTTLAPTTMSAPENRNTNASGAYTSPRAAKKMILSRRPSTAKTDRIATVCHQGNTPITVCSAGIGPVPSDTSAMASNTTRAP
jgi:hypothetical protein